MTDLDWRQSLDGRGVVVTGGGGFLGRHLTARASRCGARVVAPPRSEADVLEARSLGRAIAEARPDIIVHAAGLADWRREPALVVPQLQTHVLGAAHVLEAARAVGVSRVVLVGSAGEYGAAPAPQSEQGPTLPMDPYSASKLAATDLALMYHRAFGVPCTVVRPFNVYGPGEKAGRLWPTLFALAAAGGGEMSLTPGEQVRDFVWVEDVAEGILRAAVAPAASGQVLNLGSGHGHRVRDAVSLAIAQSGGNIHPRFGAAVARGPEPPALVADTTRLREVLGWAPATSLADGLARYWRTFTPT